MRKLYAILLGILIMVEGISSSASFVIDEEGGSIRDDKRNEQLSPYLTLDNILVNELPKEVFNYSEPKKTEPFLNLPMRYETIASEKVAEKDTAIAVMSPWGTPMVLYNPKRATEMGNVKMGVVLQHEYCHHDLRGSGREKRSIVEAQADCCAAFNLKTKYQREDAVNEIVQFLLSKGECKYDKKTPISEVTADHPCAQQRAYIYDYCMKSNVYQLDREFLNKEFPL